MTNLYNFLTNLYNMKTVFDFCIFNKAYICKINT